jgi:hypothetical protein
MTARLVARFADPVALVAALDRLGAGGLRDIEIFTPHPVPEAEQRLPHRRSPIPWLVCAAGFAGAAGGFLMEVYAAAWSYPINIGGRPLLSWPAFVPIAFEIGVLCAVAMGFFAFLTAAGLPRLFHPLAGAPGFAEASRDAYLLVLQVPDRMVAGARVLLTGPDRVVVTEVPS